MSTIYLVIDGAYSDWEIIGAFSDRNKAALYCDAYEATRTYSQPYVQEVQLDEIEVGDRSYTVWQAVFTAWDQWIDEVETQDVYLTPSDASPKFSVQASYYNKPYLSIKVTVCASTPAAVKKILHDEIARYRYEGQFEMDLAEIKKDLLLRLRTSQRLGYPSQGKSRDIAVMKDTMSLWGVDWEDIDVTTID